MPKIKELLKRQVFFYTYNLPQPTGSGSHIRQFTNIRAYVDLGFHVNLVHISNDESITVTKELSSLGVNYIKKGAHLKDASILSRFAYQLGWPFARILDLMYKDRPLLRDEVLRREKRSPGAIHHFEYLNTACAAIGLKGINTIWSCLDFVSERNIKISQMRAEIGKIKKPREFSLRIKYLRQMEKLVAESCRVVFAIADHEKAEFRKRWGLHNIELLPMSWPDEVIIPRSRDWIGDGKLKLLHLGSVDAFIGYYSLYFLLFDVFPILPEHILNNIELIVVGKISGTEYSLRIKRLAKEYPQVKIMGFVPDVRPYYADTDLQVVGSGVATGLRTRIIESFVYGLPVLSTNQSAEGILGLDKGENILLALDAPEFVRHILEILENPNRLPNIALRARDTYSEYYSRQVAADMLATLLEKYML